MLTFGYNTHIEHENVRLVEFQNDQNLPLNNTNALAVGVEPQTPLGPLICPPPPLPNPGYATASRITLTTVIVKSESTLCTVVPS